MTATSTLPVDAVKALDAARVAGWLGLEPSGRERHKFPCVWCESGDALDLKPGKSPKCFSCGKSGSVVDLAMQKLGLEFVEAVKWLADRAGILVPHRPTFPSVGKISPPVILVATSQPLPAAPEPLSADSADPFSWGDAYKPDDQSPARQRVAVYTALVELCPPGPASLAYLAKRKLAYPETLRELGFFEISDWDQVARMLLDRFSREMLTAAFPPNDTGKFPRPFGGRPVLGVAYQCDGEVYAVRFRNLDPTAEKRHRYRDCHGVPPTFPWHADSLRDLAGHDLHVVEGELNALSLWGTASDLRVVAVPGAGRIPGGRNAPWLRAAGQAKRVLCWYDADRAGNTGGAAFRWTLCKANGWEVSRPPIPIVRACPQLPGDLNELLCRGHLDGLISELDAAA